MSDPASTAPTPASTPTSRSGAGLVPRDDVRLRALRHAAWHLGAGLAVVPVLPQLTAALDAHGAAVVHAPPGTGKTTAVPPAVAGWLADRTAAGDDGGRVLVTQPRRVAVRAAWRRLHSAVAAALDATAPNVTAASELDPSAVVGYAVRGDAVGAGRSDVEFVTPGLLVRRLLADPGLDGVGAVILDEVHERDLDTDVLFALLADLRQLRPELVLVAMSATVDAAALAARWELGMGQGPGAVPVVRTPAVQHPLTVEHAPFGGPRLTAEGRVDRAFLDHVAAAAVRAHSAALARDGDVDALVFLPGAAEAQAVAERIARCAPAHEVRVLHGRQEPAEQDAALAGRADPGVPRIVVATAVAESSLTVPGVRLVVDSGLAREPRRDRGRGITGLVTLQASQASAGQRAGRAARLGPGTVVRCHTPAALGAAPPAPTPSLAVADLTPVALAFAAWGAPGGTGLVLPEDPPADALSAAQEVLRGLGAVDDAGRVTAYGARLAALPVDPALGHALLVGAPQVGAEAAAETVAALGLGLRATDADLEALLRALRSGAHPQARRWRTEADRLVRLTVGRDRRARRRASDGATGDARTLGRAGATGAGVVVALAHPQAVARRVPGTQAYLLASGTRASLPRGVGEGLGGAPWLAVAEVDRVPGDAEGTGAAIRLAAAVDETAARAAAAAFERTDDVVQWHGERLRGRRRTLLGSILLAEAPGAVSVERAAEAVRAALAEGGLARFEPAGSSGGGGDAGGPGERLRRRVHVLHRVLGEPWPDLSDAGLAALDPFVDGVAAALAAGRAARSVDVAGLLHGLLPWPAAGRLGELAPERLEIPSGRAVRVDYPATDQETPPVVAAKLQEFLGAAHTPAVADGRLPVVLHLLSPAGRPLAVTADLPSFWTGAYAHVRAENRGRYPKHPWPADPTAALPTARTRHRPRA